MMQKNGKKQTRDNMEYIIRKNNEAELDFNNRCVKLNEYPYLKDYEYRFDEYDLFNEIVYDEKVVGFSTFTEEYGTFTLNDVYILPEFRDLKTVI